MYTPCAIFMFCPVYNLTVCVWWILSGIVISLLEKKELAVLHFSDCNNCADYHGSFAFPLAIIGRLCFVIVTLPRHLLYCIRHSSTGLTLSVPNVRRHLSYAFLF